MVTMQLSGVSNPFSLRLASDVLFGIVLCFYFCLFVCLVEIEQKEVRAAMALKFQKMPECFFHAPFANVTPGTDEVRVDGN